MGASVGAYADVKVWAKLDSGTLTFYYGDKGELNKDEHELKGGIQVWPDWPNKSEEITKAVFDESFKNAQPVLGYAWFCGSENLTTIENISYLNTSSMRNMGRMFDGCSSLKSLDFSNFKTTSATDMTYMFNSTTVGVIV